MDPTLSGNASQQPITRLTANGSRAILMWVLISMGKTAGFVKLPQCDTEDGVRKFRIN